MAITLTTANNVHKQEAQVINVNYDEDFIPGAKCDGDNNNRSSNCAFVVDNSDKSCITTDYGVIVLKRSYRKKTQRQRTTENKMSSSANTSLLPCTTFCQFTAITNWVEKNTGMKEFCGRSSSVLKSTTTTTKSNYVRRRRRRRRKKNVSSAAVDPNNNSFVDNDISFLTDISMMDNVIDEEEAEHDKKSNSKKKKMKKKLSSNFHIIKKSFIDYVLKM